MAESQQEDETFVNQTLVSETEEESEEFEQVDIQEAFEKQTSENEEDSDDFERLELMFQNLMIVHRPSLSNKSILSKRTPIMLNIHPTTSIEPLEKVKIEVPKMVELRKSLSEQEKENAELEAKLKATAERRKELEKQLEKKLEAQERENAEIEAKLKAATERRKELERLIEEKLRARDQQELEEANESK
ncbi:28163_t:CDS:2 [Dentiscutata erythropus]|uniref:28163_t:CDS:1 n=1 Tax=Dentiscutata erythropus TaxID=1348616 RepID=A0A9N9IVQ9_9GLOM|nr:28163_t:CDS:2 [Dentiscutata erythropus]